MFVHQVVNLSLKRLLSPIELYKKKRGLLRFVHRVFDDIKIIGIRLLARIAEHKNGVRVSQINSK